jgi:uncharacterized damage-inducible protein DinB
MLTTVELQAVPTPFKHYVEHVRNLQIMDALSESSAKMQEFLKTVPEAKGTYRYAEGKWSIKEVLNHLIDAERIFAYRALRFARNDKTELHGFEENDYAPEANAHARTVKELASEMIRLRATTIDLFASFTPEMLERKGKASKNEALVKVYAYLIGGHEMHHLSIFKERYMK